MGCQFDAVSWNEAGPHPLDEFFTRQLARCHPKYDLFRFFNGSIQLESI